MQQLVSQNLQRRFYPALLLAAHPCHLADRIRDRAFRPVGKILVPGLGIDADQSASAIGRIVPHCEHPESLQPVHSPGHQALRQACPLRNLRDRALRVFGYVLDDRHRARRDRPLTLIRGRCLGDLAEHPGKAMELACIHIPYDTSHEM